MEIQWFYLQSSWLMLSIRSALDFKSRPIALAFFLALVACVNVLTRLEHL